MQRHAPLLRNKDNEKTRASDRDVRGAEIVKAIKTYSTSALTPCPPRYPPAQNSYSLPNWQSVFNLFFPSLLEIGETKINSCWQAIQQAGELQGLHCNQSAASQGPWNERPWERHQRHRGCRVTLGPQSEKRGIYCLGQFAAMKNHYHKTQREGQLGWERWWGETDRGSETEVGGVCTSRWGLGRVCRDLCVLLSCAMCSTRYDVKKKTNAFFLSLSPMGNDSLAFGDLERGSAGQSICMGPSVNMWFLLVISWCGPVVVNIAWQLTAWLFLSSLEGGGGVHRW